MRIGILGYGLDRPLSGVTRVGIELTRALAERDDVEVTLLRAYRNGPFSDDPRIAGARLPFCRLLPVLMALGGPLIAAQARRHRLDLVHDPIGIAPFTIPRRLGGPRAVATIHDAIAFEYPDGYPLLNNVLHRRYIPWTLRNVDRVVTDSAHGRDAIARHMRLDPLVIDVVPLAIASHFTATPSAGEIARVRASYGLERPFLLFVGAFQARKNVVGLIDAFAQAHPRLPDVDMVLVGPRQWSYPLLAERLAALDPDDRPRVLGYVPDADLAALYAAATAVVVPSLFEGFGIPVLEAMARGAPVICSIASSLPEVAGDAALMVDPRDRDAIANAMIRVATDQTLADDLRHRGLARAAAFTWAETARRYVEIYRSLA